MPQTSACIFSQVLSVQTLPGKTDDTDIDLKKKKKSKKQQVTGLDENVMLYKSTAMTYLFFKQINRNNHSPFFKDTAEVTLAHSWQLVLLTSN